MNEQSSPTKTRVAAVQMEARVADVPYNIDHAARLIDDAIAQNAKIIAIPEFFTTRIVYDERLFECSLPPENPALDMLVAKATRSKVHIGGSYLEMRDGDVYNTYVLVEPDGKVHRHDKDLPTMVENAFYVGGCDDGLMDTSLGKVGAAVCWEMVRTQTVRRLVGKVDLLMTGSHWWSEPGWPVLGSAFAEKFHAGNGRLMHRTPGFLAGYIGAPLLHAGHCGILEGGFLTVPGTRLTVATKTQLMGETQIIDARGTILKSRHYSEGPGLIVDDIALGAQAPRQTAPDGFWIPNLDKVSKLLWVHQNACGKAAYKWAKHHGKLKTYDFSRNSTRTAL